MAVPIEPYGYGYYSQFQQPSSTIPPLLPLPPQLNYSQPPASNFCNQYWTGPMTEYRLMQQQQAAANAQALMNLQIEVQAFQQHYPHWSNQLSDTQADIHNPPPEIAIAQNNPGALKTENNSEELNLRTEYENPAQPKNLQPIKKLSFDSNASSQKIVTSTTGDKKLSTDTQEITEVEKEPNMWEIKIHEDEITEIAFRTDPSAPMQRYAIPCGKDIINPFEISKYEEVLYDKHRRLNAVLEIMSEGKLTEELNDQFDVALNELKIAFKNHSDCLDFFKRAQKAKDARLAKENKEQETQEIEKEEVHVTSDLKLKKLVGLMKERHANKKKDADTEALKKISYESTALKSHVSFQNV